MTPQAMLMPDQGTMPMRRRTERRTHAADFCFWCFAFNWVGEDVGGGWEGEGEEEGEGREEGVGGDTESEKAGVVSGGYSADRPAPGPRLRVIGGPIGVRGIEASAVGEGDGEGEGGSKARAVRVIARALGNA